MNKTVLKGPHKNEPRMICQRNECFFTGKEHKKELSSVFFLALFLETQNDLIKTW